jgi:hypothetical protein
LVGEVSVPGGTEKREWVNLCDLEGRMVLEMCSSQDGNETNVDESNQLNHVPPIASGQVNPSYTGRMKVPSQSESAVGFSNLVEVRGNSFIKATELVGPEELASHVVGYITTEADLAEILGSAEAAATNIANYGWIKAPTFYIPEATTVDDCKVRAKRMLAKYITYLKRAVPSVVGRSPALRSIVSYHTPRMLSTNQINQMKNSSDAATQDRVIGGLWAWGNNQGGRVVRVKNEYSSRAGWVCFIEVQPYLISDAAAAELYTTVEGGSIGN